MFCFFTAFSFKHCGFLIAQFLFNADCYEFFTFAVTFQKRLNSQAAVCLKLSKYTNDYLKKSSLLIHCRKRSLINSFVSTLHRRRFSSSLFIFLIRTTKSKALTRGGKTTTRDDLFCGREGFKQTIKKLINFFFVFNQILDYCFQQSLIFRYESQEIRAGF